MKPWGAFMEKLRHEVSKADQARPIEWLEQRPEITQYLHSRGFTTVGEVVANQADIPQDYWTRIMAKLIFGVVL
jgi:hypothetical protein